MSSQTMIDCIIVGYNDIDFETFANQQKAMEPRSGAYHEIRTNSVLLDGKRTLYMDLINRAIADATGHNPRLNVFESPALGVCYLQGFLQQRNFSVETVNFFTYEKEKFKQLLAQSPLSVAITTTFYIDNAPIIEIVNFVRKHNPAVKIIVGGPHIYNISCDYDEDAQAYVFQEIGADIYIADSQGELTLSHVVHQLRNGGNLSQVPNLAYFADSGTALQRTQRLPENNNMDLNSIRWETFDPNVIAPIAYVRTARSCPFACSFCNYPTLAGSHDLTSLEMIERELDGLSRAGTKVVVFVDDTFNVPLPRFKKLLQLMIDKKYDFKWVSFLRCSNVDETAVDLMKASGCVGVLLGIESGDQTILNYMNKSATLDRYRWGIRELAKRNIATYASLICGFPGESEETVRNSINFIEETGPTFFNVQLYYHDSRSPIHRRAEEFEIQGGGYSWQHKTMTWREAADWAGYMFKHIHNSIPMTLYGFSLWGIAYLVSKGISMESIAAFGKIAREMFIPGLNDIELDYTHQTRRLAEVFKDVHVVPAKGTNGAAASSMAAAKRHTPGSPSTVDQYWLNRLSGIPRRVDLTYDLLPIAGQGSSANTQSFDLTADVTQRLCGLAEENKTELSVVLLALFKLFLFQLTKQIDICVHVRLPGHRELPIRSHLAVDMEFSELLHQLHHSVKEALAYQDYSLSRLVHKLYADDHNPSASISNVRYTYHRGAVGEPHSGNVRFDLELHVEELEIDGSPALRLTAEYNDCLFVSTTIQTYLAALNHFSQTLARQVVVEGRLS